MCPQSKACDEIGTSASMKVLKIFVEIISTSDAVYKKLYKERPLQMMLRIVTSLVMSPSYHDIIFPIKFLVQQTYTL